jgi:hypothetical protein
MASPDPDHGIIFWTLVFAAISTAGALATTFFAWRTVKYGKDAVGPLKETVTRLDSVAKLLSESTQAAERVQETEKLLRQIEACGEVLDALLSISLIEGEAAAEAIDDLDVMTMRVDAKFLVIKNQILSATHQLPAGLLPKTAIVAALPRLSGSGAFVSAARQEVAVTLDQLQRELQALGRPPEQSA